jgi:signal transduction histidine kinase/CheY-like chemotaxis protein
VEGALSWRREVTAAADALAARAAVLAVCRAGGLDAATRSSLAVAVSEVAHRVCDAGGGEVRLEVDGPALVVSVLGPRPVLEEAASRCGELVPGTELAAGVLHLAQALPRRDEAALAAALASLDAEPEDEVRRLERHDAEMRELLGRLSARDDALERLDAELEETNRGVVALYAELDERDRRKNEFLATLAHELRNPLGVVGTALHAVRERNGHSEHVSRPLEVAERQLWHLARLVDDLLDVSRIDQGKITLHREHVDLAEVVRRAVESSGPLIERRGHRLDVDLGERPLVLDADPVRLEQVVDNLLSNAAKYTPEGGEIEIRTRAEDATAVLTVEDDGIGIAPEMLGRIFQLFAQADKSLERSSGGLGLGLALVERLVALHDGTVTAESAGEGEGSRFTVRLPLADTSEEEDPLDATRDETGPDAAAPGPVLLVEDNEDAREMLALLLEGRGFEVDTAEDGARGVERMESGEFGAAVVDIGLPGLDGYEVARRVRAGEAETGRRTLLIALSGYGRSEDRERSEEAGFDHHLVKPVDPDELCGLLRGRRSGRSG